MVIIRGAVKVLRNALDVPGLHACKFGVRGPPQEELLILMKKSSLPSFDEGSAVPGRSVAANNA
jgi:hypothetical protein